MRKLAYLIAFLAVLAGCSGHAATVPSRDAATSAGARAVRSLGGAGTTTITYNDTYAPVGQCSSGVLTVNNGYTPVTSLSFPAGQGPQLVLSNCNFSTPQYVQVTLGTPAYGFPYIRQDGYAITVDAFGPAQVTATWTALGSTLPGTPGLSGTVTFTIGSPVDFTTVWQTGSGTTGQFATPGPDDGQCAGQGPTVNGNNIVFKLVRDTNNTTYPGGSACYRNQVNPTDPNTGSNLLFTMGKHYTFHFRTVVTLNGNSVYTAPNGQYAIDIPAIVWQTHPFVANAPDDTGPCDTLLIDNTRRAYNVGDLQYGDPVNEPGSPTWNFHTCSEAGEFAPGAYNSEIISDGETDDWQIDIDAQYTGQGGHVTVVRNGNQVYDNGSGVCLASTVNDGCWWNFGPYFYFWKDTQKPSTENPAGITVKVKGMALTTPVSGGQTLSRKRRM
jgi:hypothetical protein